MQRLNFHHLERRLQAWEACESEAGERLAGVGVQVVEFENDADG